MSPAPLTSPSTESGGSPAGGETVHFNLQSPYARYSVAISFFFHFLIFFFPPPVYRQNAVEDLVKLARLFDKNMQDRESLEGVHNSFSECANTSKPKLRPADKMKGLQCSSSSDSVEAELQALFDCSTQKVSGRLSQGSTASVSSQDKPVAAHLVETRLKAPEKSVPAAEVKAAALGSNDDFDDDWENDDLLNDPLLLEITQNPPRLLDKSEPLVQSNTNTENSQSCSGFQSTTKTACARQPSAANSKLTCSSLQELCPKPKTTNRSTFKLEPNPHFQAKNPSKPTVPGVQPKPQICLTNSAIAKPLCQSDRTSNFKAHICEAADSLQGISDSLWDDGDDDTLLYQVCDSVERISNSQLDQVSSRHKKWPHLLEERGPKCTTPVPIGTAGSSTKRESPRTFVRSNSLPATSSGAVSFRGWDIPMKSTNNKSQMSQSLPGCRVALGTFNQSRDSSGKRHTGNDGATEACMGTSHTAFKRNFSDSAVTSNKGKTFLRSIYTFAKSKMAIFLQLYSIKVELSKQMFHDVLIITVCLHNSPKPVNTASWI